MSFWDITAQGVLDPILNFAAGQINAKQQFNRQKQLMDLQLQNQRLLNQQGSDIQMDMWNKTNYQAQVQQLKAAGLNPSMLYGKGGQGGVTGSQGGGSAASGNAQMAQMMDINIAKNLAEIRLLQAQADNQNSQAEANRGYLKDQSTATTANLKQTFDLIETQIGTEQAKKLNIEADTVLKQLEAYVKDKTKDNQVEMVNQSLDQLRNLNDKMAIEIMMGEKDLAVKDELLGQLILQNNLNIVMTGLQMDAVKKGLEFTEEQMKKIRSEIQQEWKKIDLQSEGLQISKDGQKITLRGQTLDYNLGIFQGRVTERGQNMNFRMNKYQTDEYNKTAIKTAHINGLYGIGKESLSILGDAYTIPLKMPKTKPPYKTTTSPTWR